MADDDVITQNRRGAVPADGSAEPSYRPATVTEFILNWLFTWFASNDTPAPAPDVEINEPRAEASDVDLRSAMQPAAALSLTNTPTVKPFAAATHQADPALSADGFSWKAVGEMYGFDASALETLPADVEIEDSEMTNQNSAFGKSWQSAAKALYELKNGEGSWAEHVAEKGWGEQEARVELAEYAEARVGWFNNNFGSLGATWALESDEYKATLMYLVEMNERTSWDASDFGNGAWKMVADLTNYPTAIASLFTFGGAAAAAVAAREAAKAAVKGSATQMLKTGIKVQLSEAAVTAAADSAMRQDIEMHVQDKSGNAMSEFSYTRLATDTAMGLGAAIGFSGGSYLAGRLARDTGLGDAASRIATKALDVTGDALGAGLDVVTFRLWRAPGELVRAIRDPSSVDLAGALQRAQSFGRSVDGSVEIGPRPDGGKSGPKADGDTTAKKDAPEARDANGDGANKKPVLRDNARMGQIDPNNPFKRIRAKIPQEIVNAVNSRAPEKSLRTLLDFSDKMRDDTAEFVAKLSAAGKNAAAIDAAFQKYIKSADEIDASLDRFVPAGKLDSNRGPHPFAMARDGATNRFDTADRRVISKYFRPNITSLQREGIQEAAVDMRLLARELAEKAKQGEIKSYLNEVSQRVNNADRATRVQDSLIVASWDKQLKPFKPDSEGNYPIGRTHRQAGIRLERTLAEGSNAFTAGYSSPVGSTYSNRENLSSKLLGAAQKIRPGTATYRQELKELIMNALKSDRMEIALADLQDSVILLERTGSGGEQTAPFPEFDLVLKDVARELVTDSDFRGKTTTIRTPDGGTKKVPIAEYVKDANGNSVMDAEGKPEVIINDPYFLGQFERLRNEKKKTWESSPQTAADPALQLWLGSFLGMEKETVSERAIRGRASLASRRARRSRSGEHADSPNQGHSSTSNDIRPFWYSRQNNRFWGYLGLKEVDWTETYKKMLEDGAKWQYQYADTSKRKWWWGRDSFLATFAMRYSGADLPNAIIRTLPDDYLFGRIQYLKTHRVSQLIQGAGLIGAAGIAQTYEDEWPILGYTPIGPSLAGYITGATYQATGIAATATGAVAQAAGLGGWSGWGALQGDFGGPYDAAYSSVTSLFGSSPQLPSNPSTPQTPIVPGVDVARRALIAPELRTYVDSEINKNNPLYVIDTGTFQANHPDFIDDADAQERIFNRTLDLLAAQSSIDISVGANIDAVWTQARAAIQEEDRVAAIKTALVDLLENNNYETAVAEQRVSALLVDQYGRPVENSSILAMFSDKSSSLYNPAFNTPGVGYSIPYSEYQKALAAFNQNQAKLNQKRGEFEARVIAALEGYAADLGVSVSELGPKVKTAAEIIAMVENPPGTFYTEEFLKGPQGKTARALALQEGEKKPSPDTPEEDTTIGGVRVPQSASEAWASAWKGLHEFSDLDNDGKSEISSALYATENVLGGAFNLAGNAFGGKYGKRGEMYAAYGTGLIAALLGTSLIKRVLGIQSWPLVGIIIGAVLFFGTSNFAYAAMTKGGRDTDDGEGDKNGGSQGGNNFIDAAKKSTISRTMLSDGTGVTFNVNIDDDPELEEVSIINRDGNDSAVLQVKDVQNGGKFVATRYLDLKQATRDAQFVATGNTFGIVLDPKQPDRTINFEIIDENGKRKSVITINGQEHKLDMIAESEALLELDKFEPAPQQ